MKRIMSFLSAFSFGGISKLDNNLVLPGNLISAVVPMYGAGDYDNVTLQKMLAGKKASRDTCVSVKQLNQFQRIINTKGF